MLFTDFLKMWLAVAKSTINRLFFKIACKTRFATHPFSRSAPYLCIVTAKERCTDETNPGMARSLGFQHNGKYLRSLGLQFQVELGSGDDGRNECGANYCRVKN